MSVKRPPEDYLHAGVVVIPARCAAVLDSLVPNAVRQQIRDNDFETFNVLLALRMVGLRYKPKAGSGHGTSLAAGSEPAEAWSAAQAAEVIGVSVRAVTKACVEKRLPARQIDGRWLITPTAAREFRAARAA